MDSGTNPEVPEEEVCIEMEKTLKEKSTANRDAEKPTIYKIPDSLRRENSDAYTPRLISLGPVHRHRGELKHTEDLKWRYLEDLLTRGTQERRSLRTYVAAVSEVEPRARRQYSPEINLPPPGEFVRLLVLDGCFLIEFLLKRVNGQSDPPLTDVKWNLPMFRSDLLLLENQIPIFVLEALFEASRFPDATGTSFLQLAVRYVAKKESKWQVLDGSGIDHLLHLNYEYHLRNFDATTNRIISRTGRLYRLKREITEPLFSTIFYIISLLLMFKRPRLQSKRKEDDKAPRTIPSARNLEQAGVHFKTKIQGKFAKCYLDVSFTDDGTLEIPFLPLQQSTISSFLNLIAFEQTCKGSDTPFTAYATFMDKIIDTAEDVEILVKKGIIESKLGSNEDVVGLFNGICRGACLDYDRHYLVVLFKEVNAYCESDRNRWRADLVRRFFHNPWAVLSLLAALVLLVLTLAGTVATIIQTKYSVKSYQKQFP